MPAAVLDCGEGQLCATLDDHLGRQLEAAGGNPARVILALDLDETTFTVAGYEECGLATSAWLSDLSDEYEDVMTEHGRESVLEVLRLCEVFYHHCPVVPVEPGLPQLVERWRERGVTVLGVTARMPALAEATLVQMQGTCPVQFSAAPGGVDWSSDKVEGLLRQCWSPWPGWPGLRYHGGVWFTGIGDKGKLLRVLAPEGVGVVFADDNRGHCESVVSALHGRNPVAAVHYPWAIDAARRSYKRAVADRRLASLLAKMHRERDSRLAKLLPAAGASQGMRGLVGLRALPPGGLLLRLWADERHRAGCEELAELAGEVRR